MFNMVSGQKSTDKKSPIWATKDTTSPNIMSPDIESPDRWFVVYICNSLPYLLFSLFLNVIIESAKGGGSVHL